MSSTTSPAVAVPSTGQQQLQDQPKIKLYWLEQSRSQRILWLLEILSIPYELIIFHRDPKTRLAPPELKEVHALGKSPVVSVSTTVDSKPIVIAESANIIEYLLEHYGKESTLLPKRYKDGQEGKVGGETEEWLRYRYFMHYAEGSLMGLLMIAIVANSIKNSPVPFFIRPITGQISSKITNGYLAPQFSTHFTFLEQQLATSSGAYLCGPNLTGADILLSFPLIAAKGRAGLTEEKYPLLSKYVDSLEKEEGYVKAAEKIKEIDGKFEATFKL